MKVVEAYVQGRDVLPTGYGKSLVFNKLTEGHEGNHSIVVVDTTAIMEDQVSIIDLLSSP